MKKNEKNEKLKLNKTKVSILTNPDIVKGGANTDTTCSSGRTEEDEVNRY